MTVRWLGRAALLGMGTRAGDRGRRWVVRFPVWLRRGVTGDEAAVQRLSAVTLYAAFGPLALLVELTFGAWHDHPVVLALGALSLAAQAAWVWRTRPMPAWGWNVLVLAVPATFVVFGIASQRAGQALGVVLVVPIAWTAAFLSARLVAVSVAANVAAIGTLLADGGSRGEWTLIVVRSMTFAVVAAGIHALVGSLRKAHQAAQLRADTDSTTGALSRSRMLDVLAATLGGPTAEPPATGLLLVDIDHFKRLNDAYGHVAGDEALRDVVGALRGALRDTDLIARWGGEEFLVLTPDLPSVDALRTVAEKLRGAVEAHAFTIDGCSVSLTVSVGAALSRAGLPVRELVAAADDALYDAKRSGRNRARVASPRISQLHIDATPTDLATIRRRVQAAAGRAGLPSDQVTDVALAASEACAHLLRRTAPGSHHSLKITTHDRDHQFTISIHDDASAPSVAREDPLEPDLDITILTTLADAVQAEEAEGESALTIIFSKRPGAFDAHPAPAGSAPAGQAPDAPTSPAEAGDQGGGRKRASA